MSKKTPKISGDPLYAHALSLAIGDLVSFNKKGPLAQEGRSLAFDDIRVVTDASIHSNGVDYAVGGCAWYTRDDLKFVARATEESLNQAIEQAADREEDDEEEIDSDEEDDDDEDDDNTPGDRAKICSRCGYLTGLDGDTLYKCYVPGSCPARSGYTGKPTAVGPSCRDCAANPSSWRPERLDLKACNVEGFCPFKVIKVTKKAKTKKA